ncbi:MAG: hypothetical protein KGM24_07570 [Elusimicrobia bacterium]|nr:hypothetical protein [Elusimicrobiota bacterium]
MLRALLLAAALPLSGALAGPVGPAEPQAAAATGFPGAYLNTISLSLAADPLYGSRFLDAMTVHVQTVCGMTAPAAVSGYLASAATDGAGDLKGYLAPILGRKPLDPPKAAALLVAEALAKPDQFREVVEGLETLKPGLGRHAAAILRAASGLGAADLIAALRSAGRAAPRGAPLTYGRDGRFDRLFDGSPARPRSYAADDAVDAPAYGDGMPRRTGLSLPPRR